MTKLLVALAILASTSTTLARVATQKDVAESSLPVETLRLRCEEGIARAEDYFKNGAGMNDGAGLLMLSRGALETCRIYSVKAGGWNGISEFISTGKKLCEKSASQRSDLSHAICIMNVTQTVRTIVM